jgi:hypothetical protein
MNMGRNDPCPCGSGKKFKKCCMGKIETDPLQDLKDDIRDFIESREFGSIEEAQAAVNDFNRGRNSAPHDDFHGLSPQQMHRFLHFPYESPELLTFPGHIATEPDCKATFLVRHLLERIDADGIKLTAKGNLGLKLSQEIVERYLEHYQNPFLQSAKIRSEQDFEELNTIRLTAQLGGLLRKHKGKLLLTHKCKKALHLGGMKALYPILLKAYTSKFNWAFRDRYESLDIVQQSFLFTLFLLQKYGATWRPAEFYADCFLQAFPMAVMNVEQRSYDTPAETLQRIYTLRSLERFANFFGLAELKLVSSKSLYQRKYNIRATGLLEAAVRFAALDMFEQE